MAFDLSVAWALILAFAICVYVVLDGFDLGIGMLYPFFPEKRDRDLMMNAVAPVWDGNETWLVLGGGGLMAAFPLAYAIIMPAVYPPVIAMLLALIFRGVAFEFRWRAVRPRTKLLWDWAFIFGSGVAALAQGIILGAHPAGHRRRGPRLRRRLVGLADAVQRPLRLRGDQRLRPARRLLAQHEDRGAAAHARQAAGARLRHRHRRLHRRRQPLDAVPRDRLLGALVLLAAAPRRRAGADRRRRPDPRARPGRSSPRAASGCRSCCRWRCSCSASSASASRCGPTSCRRR